MAYSLIPLGRLPDPRLEALSAVHDTTLAIDFGADAERGAVIANGLIGKPSGGASVWPDGLVALDRSLNQSVDFETNFGIGTNPFFVLFGVTVPESGPVNGAWLKLGVPTGVGAGYGFGLGGGGSTGFEASGSKITALYEDRAWLASSHDLDPGFHTVCFYHDGNASRAVHFFRDGVALQLVTASVGSEALAPSAVARFGGYASSGGDNRHTSCRLHFAVIGSLRAGVATPLDLVQLAAGLYPPGEYVPHTALRSTFYSLPSGPIGISWSSLTASNMTPTTATLTLGGITR